MKFLILIMSCVCFSLSAEQSGSTSQRASQTYYTPNSNISGSSSEQNPSSIQNNTPETPPSGENTNYTSPGGYSPPSSVKQSGSK